MLVSILYVVLYESVQHASVSQTGVAGVVDRYSVVVGAFSVVVAMVVSGVVVFVDI